MPQEIKGSISRVAGSTKVKADVSPAVVERHIQEVLDDADRRGTYLLSSPSHLTDADWKDITEIAHTYWPNPKEITVAQKMAFMQRHDHAAIGHFLDFVFELERVYSILNWLKDEREKRADASSTDG